MEGYNPIRLIIVINLYNILSFFIEVLRKIKKKD